MLKGTYTSRLVDANFTAKLWMCIGVSMMVVNALLAVKIFTTHEKEKTILVPSAITKPMWIKGEAMSPTYVEELGRYFANLLLVYQKETAQAQFNEVLRFVAPEIYPKIKTKLDQDADRISRTQISSIFYLTTIHVKETTAFVTGDVKAFVGGALAKSGEKTYQFTFEQTGGGVRITAFKEVKRTNKGEYEPVVSEEGALQ